MPLAVARDPHHSPAGHALATIRMSTYGVSVFKVIHAAFIAPGIKRFTIEAPRIARKHRPGQFVIVRLYEQGERIPLTIERADAGRGTINLVVQSAGKTTHLLNRFESGDSILDVVGPLGKPSEIKNFGTVVVMGGGVGTAMAYPTAAALKKAGNRVISIVGARNKELVILEREMGEVSEPLLITTDDGSYDDKSVDSERPKQLIRFDGTGMCGGCRVLIDGKSEFACVDGPEFDAHRVNFDVLIQRNAMYREAERRSMEQFRRDTECKPGAAQAAGEEACVPTGGRR